MHDDGLLLASDRIRRLGFGGRLSDPGSAAGMLRNVATSIVRAELDVASRKRRPMIHNCGRVFLFFTVGIRPDIKILGPAAEQQVCTLPPTSRR